MSTVVPTTLCYIDSVVNGEKCYLMIHKKRPNDPNKDKYLGIGGHFNEGESSEECILREIKEETGISKDELSNLSYRGVVHFISDEYGKEDMHLFTASLISSPAKILTHKCEEGELIWYPISRVKELPIWEGDKIMFDEIFSGNKKIALTLVYKGSKLVEVK